MDISLVKWMLRGIADGAGFREDVRPADDAFKRV